MMLRKYFTFLSCFRHNLSRIPTVPYSRFSSSSFPPHTQDSNVKVEVSPDGKSIVCWHPEPTIPYEHTKPLPRNEEEIKESDSVLKIQYLMDLKTKFKPDGPSDKELTKMFTTDRPYWRPRPRRRYANPNPPLDRKSI